MNFLSLNAALLAFAMVTPAVPIEPTDREKVIAAAESQVGVREATGKNDGEVDKYLKAVSLGGSRAPYCAAFNTWVGDEALGRSSNPYPRSAWSPDHVKGGVRFTKDTNINGGEAFGIWFKDKGRVAHTGLCVKKISSGVVTIEANTSASAAFGSAQDREGHGVYRKLRPITAIHSIRDWLDNPKKP
jgi:hypothetical protein